MTVRDSTTARSCSEWLPPPAPAHYQVTREQRDDDDDDESHADSSGLTAAPGRLRRAFPALVFKIYRDPDISK
jgi:hypothetical protein